MNISVMTYNIRHGLGSDYVQSLDRIAEVIRTVGADIVCLQEVNSGLGRNPRTMQARWLAGECGYVASYSDNWRVWPIRGMGNAILTREAPYSTWNNRLPFSREPRGVLETRIRVSRRDATVYATHWGLHAGERLRQAYRCAEIVAEGDSRAIFCGDLNVTSDSPEVRELLQGTGLLDTWPDGPPTYAVAEPTARIDYVLVSSHWTVKRRTRVETDASDHFPVVIELELTG